jgi:hypothetical protein
VLQEDVIVLHPFLEGTVLDVHMAATFCGTFCICHHDGGSIVFVQPCGSGLGEPELNQDPAQEFCHFSRRHGSDEFCLSGAAADYCYPFGTVGDGGTSETEDEGADRASGTCDQEINEELAIIRCVTRNGTHLYCLSEPT